METVAFIIHHVFPPSSCKCLQDARAEPGGTGAAPLPTDVVSAADTGSSEPAAEAVDSCVLCTPCMCIYIYICIVFVRVVQQLLPGHQPWELPQLRCLAVIGLL